MVDAEPIKTACKQYEARWEDYLDGRVEPAAVADLEAHLKRCGACREAVEAARWGRELLREALEPVAKPGPAFATRVMASIRAEEARREAAGAFWRPLEVLASRLALTAAVALLVLAAFLFQFRGATGHGRGAAQAEASEAFPELGGQPAPQDEALLMLAENGHGR